MTIARMFLTAIVLLVMSPLATVNPVQASCAEDCYHLNQPNDTFEAPEFQCCDVGNVLTPGECHPEMNPGGTNCSTYKLRYLEEGGCMTMGWAENGQQCLLGQIAVAVRDLVSCDYELGSCVYEAEYRDLHPETVCSPCGDDE